MSVFKRICGAATLVAALASADAAAQAADPSHRDALLAQKLRLVEQLLDSSPAQDVDAGSDADARQALGRARTLLEQARQGGERGQAGQQVEEALRLATAATRGAAGGAAQGGQLQRNAELRAQVDLYRRGVVAALQARRGVGRSPILVAVDQQLAEADDLSGAGRHIDAEAALDRAYRAAVQGLARLREGDTVTVALKFETPADEYAYEQRRYDSHELLVEMTLGERAPAGTMRNAIEQRRDDARLLRDRAAASAGRGDFASAIAQLEAATQGLVRALQAAGVTGLY